MKFFYKFHFLLFVVNLIILLILHGINIPLLSNEAFVDLYLNEKRSEPIDTNIIFVDIKHHSRDSIIKQIAIIKRYNPKVLAVDIFFKQIDERLIDEILYSENVVLPIKIISYKKGDNNKFSSTVLDSNEVNLSNVYYGIAQSTFNNFYSHFLIDNKEYISYPSQIIRCYNSGIYKKLLQKGDNVKYINYLGNVEKFIYMDDLFSKNKDELSAITNKIVLLGYLGDSSFYPEITNDKEDVHLTPIGKMYGIVLVANILHTILYSTLIVQLPNYINIIIIIIVYLINVIVINHIQLKKYFYVKLKIIQVIELLCIVFIYFFVLFHFNKLLDLKLLIFTIIVCSEVYLLGSFTNRRLKLYTYENVK